MAQTKHARVPFPPPLLFLGFFILAAGLHAVLPLPVPSSAVGQMAGGLSLVAGAVLGWWALLTLRRAHTSPDPGQPTAALVTTGPYSLTRNPIYLGFTLVFLGICLIAGSWWGLVLTPVLALIVTRVIIRAEEAYLQTRFTVRYRDYLTRVRRWI
jgi:protein-S-isoprenylcysteine O-methyltransferase Ste14